MTARQLTPEKLDALPPDSPAAQHSRRDLWRLNGLMRHRGDWVRWWRRTYPGGPPRRLAELGAGDGRLLHHVLAKAFPADGNAATLTIVDAQPCLAPSVIDGLEKSGWQVEIAAADVFRWLHAVSAQDVIVTNLFLHHFADDELREMLRLIAVKCRHFRSLEPRRSGFGLLGCRLLPLIGCHPVTRHDARVSVEAGFSVGELAALWPAAGWRITESALWPFGHVFEARSPEP